MQGKSFNDSHNVRSVVRELNETHIYHASIAQTALHIQHVISGFSPQVAWQAQTNHTQKYDINVIIHCLGKMTN